MGCANGVRKRRRAWSLAAAAKPTGLIIHTGDIRPAPLGSPDFIGALGTPYAGLNFQVTTQAQYLKNHLVNSQVGTIFGLYPTF